MTIRIFLADDHGVVREGLRFLLESQRDFVVVGEADNGLSAVQRALELRPDVAVLDIAMPHLNGIEAGRRIREACPHTQVVILSMHLSSEHIYRALEGGALGYVLKESAGDELIEAVRVAHSGRRYLSGRVTDELVTNYLHRHEGTEPVSPLAELTPREREVLQLVVEGKTSAEIADLLSLSPKTVESYRSRLMQKLNIRDLPSLVKFAIQHGLMPLE